MERKIQFLEGEFFHVFNRGVDKRKIFFTKNDKEHFFALLKKCNTTSRVQTRAARKQATGQGDSLTTGTDEEKNSLVDIAAFCLMDNHFHLLVRGHFDGAISKFMAKLGTAFSMYMNKKYKRTGPLMCRPFRSRHVDSDAYFRWLFAYIHLNPIDFIESSWKEKGLKNTHKAKVFLETYRYSSFIDYEIGERAETVILARGIAKEFDVPTRLKDLLKEYQSGQGDSLTT